jgi:hypothetical protein
MEVLGGWGKREADEAADDFFRIIYINSGSLCVCDGGFGGGRERTVKQRAIFSEFSLI